MEPSDNSHSGNTTLLSIGYHTGTQDPVAQPMGLDDGTRQHAGPSTSDASCITTLDPHVPSNGGRTAPSGAASSERSEGNQVKEDITRKRPKRKNNWLKPHEQ